MEALDDTRTPTEIANQVGRGLASEAERQASEIDTGEVAENAVYLFAGTAVGVCVVGGLFHAYDWATNYSTR
jgi:hypothetical protein